MCGIIVDMTIINIIIRNYFSKLTPLLDEKNENYGDYIGNNFINVNLINLFTNNYINENTSLLIWDLLFISGNLILIKAFLAIYNYLQPFLLESNPTIEDYQTIINQNMKQLKSDDENLLFYLVIKDYNFNEDVIEKARISLSVNISNTINKEKNLIREKAINNKEECDLNFPICKCLYYEKQSNVIFCNVLQRKNKHYIENYFMDKINNNSDINNKDKNNIENDLLIERSLHICNKKEDITSTDDTGVNKDLAIDIVNKEIKEEINYNKIINKPEFIEASKDVLNNLQNEFKTKDEKEKDN